MSAEVRRPRPRSPTRPGGGRPVRASTMWAPRWAAPDVATAPCRTGQGRRAGGGRAGPRSRCARRAAGSAADHVAAGRQAEVGVGQRGQVPARSFTAQPLTTPVGSSRRRPLGPGEHGESAAGFRSARSPRARTSATSAGSPRGSSHRGRAGRHRVGPVGAEHPVRLAEHGHGLGPGGRAAAVVGVPAAQREADRHAHDVLDVRRPSRCRRPWLRRLTARPGRARSAATEGSRRW